MTIALSAPRFPRAPRRALPASLLLGSALLAGCGGSESDADADSSGADDAAASGCTTALTVTYPDGTSVDLDEAQAVELADGGAFTVYVGDYEIPTADITTATVMPPAGSHQATVYLTPLGSLSDAEPIAAGTTVPYTTEPDTLTFSVVLLGDAGMANQATEGSGEVTVTEVGDELCLEVDYRDAEKSASGTISAPVNASAY
ncbi:hypothetical protein GCM10022215_24520 [Nocardioides fonticola]|uniref:Lipoprotein n=1 Tax=Nocardioides fonticola TaxID=450363 RepID=A0ABP7XL26_9ACTN